MPTVTTIGFDIAKSVFQVHGVDAAGEVVIRRQLKRSSVLAQKPPPCLVGIEACASVSLLVSQTPGGHTVRSMPPAYVKPDVKRKNRSIWRSGQPTRAQRIVGCGAFDRDLIRGGHYG